MHIRCEYLHGDLCDMCNRQCLNPFDPEQQKSTLYTKSVYTPFIMPIFYPLQLTGESAWRNMKEKWREHFKCRGEWTYVDSWF